MQAQPYSDKTFVLEEAIRRVKEIQSLLQEGQLNFEESLTFYEEASQLIHQSQQYLSKAEIRLQKLPD
jgi:exodeoxyribonuclease VII small subunit